MFCNNDWGLGEGAVCRRRLETAGERAGKPTSWASGRWLLAAALLNGPCLAAAEEGRDPAAPPIQGALSLTSELAANLDGGIARGNAVDHLLEASVWADGAALGLPAGSGLYASFIQTRDDQPTANLVGDAQGFSNIAASPRSFLYTLYYDQRLADEHWTVRFGLVPADHYFDTADSAALLINSSFGVQPTWSGNTVGPIYPTAGLGAMATWSDGPWLNRAGVFQADPGDRNSVLKRGALVIEEVNYEATGTFAGLYKVGLWNYGAHGPASAGLPPATWGGYAIVEHPLSDGDDASTLFFRVGWSPQDASAVPLGFQAGAFIPAPFAGRPDDQLSVGIANAHLRGQGVETAYEVTYLWTLSEHFSLQPDLQYIDNPGATYPSATVATLRLHVDF